MNRAERLNFSTWEEFTRIQLYKGQLEPIKKWISGKVLDVGSNYGRFSALSETVVSVDIEQKFLQRGIDIGNIICPVVASAMDLPFYDASFDTVVVMGLIDHIPYRWIIKLLSEITRVVKPEGTIIIQVTSPFSLYSIRFHKTFHDYVHPYSPFRLKRELRSMGWTQIHTMSSGLIGSLHILPQTIDVLLPWSVHITSVFRNQ